MTINDLFPESNDPLEIMNNSTFLPAAGFFTGLVACALGIFVVILIANSERYTGTKKKVLVVACAVFVAAFAALIFIGSASEMKNSDKAQEALQQERAEKLSGYLLERYGVETDIAADDLDDRHKLYAPLLVTGIDTTTDKSARYEISVDRDGEILFSEAQWQLVQPK